MKRYKKHCVQTDIIEGLYMVDKHRNKGYFQEVATISCKLSYHKLLCRIAACALVLGALITINSCSTSGASSERQAADGGPNSTITPVWIDPTPPAVTINQSYMACVPEHVGCKYLWSVTSGNATLIDADTAVVTFTPKATGNLQLQCVVTDPESNSSIGTYSITVELRQLQCYRRDR